MLFIFIAPMDSHVTNVIVYNLHITIFSRVYSHVTHMHSCVLVCNRKKLEWYSRVVLAAITWRPTEMHGSLAKGKIL